VVGAVTPKVGYHWHLRRLLAERGLFQTTGLVPLLAERGVVLSREQVYRLVVRTPERLNLHALAALCDALDCSPAELIEPYRQARPGRRSAGAASTTRPSPRRARVAPDPRQ
jgi:DNA-binding Xre family transcriptional regulator